MIKGKWLPDVVNSEQTRTKWLRRKEEQMASMDLHDFFMSTSHFNRLRTQDDDEWRKRWMFNYTQRRLNNICSWKSELISHHSSPSALCLKSESDIGKTESGRNFMFWRVIIHFWLMLSPMTIRIGLNCRACGNLSFTLINIHESAVCFRGNLALSSDEWNEKPRRESKAGRHASITSNC